MKICVVGTGYVGLVTGACLADVGCQIVCIDQDQSKIDGLKKNVLPIYEPGLEEVVERAVSAGNLAFTTDLHSTVAESDAVFIAVGTPQGDDGRSDLSYVEAASRQIAEALSGSTTIIVKSTVPVGTCRRVARIVHHTNPDAESSVVSNPEFLREGVAVEDFMEPDRIVIGTQDDRARTVMNAIYSHFVDKGAPLVQTTLETSELIKYSANAFLATKVAFINEMANLCDSVGANVEDLSKAIGMDERIGPSFLKPGPGYGGSCFPKDTLALTIQAQESDCPVRIVESVVSSNSFHIRRLGKRIAEFCGDVWSSLGWNETSLDQKTIAVLGLAFKADTDDIRSAASTVILPLLQKQGARIVGYDPAAMDTAKAEMPGLETAESIEAAVSGADAVLILTEWNQFKSLDWARLLPTMNAPVVVDFRNLYPPNEMSTHGAHYASLGRPLADVA
ncbi:MAG: UDP-glucose/GDP-mannose dehydrogenase family protein [Pseudomonadota bacterium]